MHTKGIVSLIITPKGDNKTIRSLTLLKKMVIFSCCTESTKMSYVPVNFEGLWFFFLLNMRK